MVLYLEIIMIIVMVIFFKNKNFTKYGIPIIIMGLTLIVGLRNNLGIDDETYIDIFKMIKNGNMWGVRNAEITYILLTKLLISMHFNYKMLFLIYAIISHTLIYLTIKKMKLNKYYFTIFILTYIVFCFFPYLTTMRQFAAISMIFYASYLCYEGKNKKAIILTIIASLFHSSAIVCLPLVFLFSEKIHISKKAKIILPLIFFIISKSNILLFLLMKINSIFRLGYGLYLSNIKNTSLNHFGLIVGAMYIIYNLQFAIKNKEKDQLTEFFQKGQLLYYIFFIMALNAGFITRFSYYFLIYQAFLFVNIIKLVKDNKNKHIFFCITMLILVFFIIYQIYDTSIIKNMSIENFSFKFLN